MDLPDTPLQVIGQLTAALNHTALNHRGKHSQQKVYVVKGLKLTSKLEEPHLDKILYGPSRHPPAGDWLVNCLSQPHCSQPQEQTFSAKGVCGERT